MPGSYERVNYTLRPAKAVERKMLCEVFRRLTHFASLDTYRYVGFGSPFYSDFLLFHRALGLKQMVNIESQLQDKARFRFNRPFGSIRSIFETSNEALPKLPWSRRSIVWLDYDTECDDGVFADIDTVCSNARSGSVLAVTLDAEFSENAGDPQRAVKKLEALKARFKTRLPQEITLKGKRHDVDASVIAEGGLPRIYACMALNAMVETCRNRSAGLAEDRRILFRQLFDFEYRDSARMVTVGGLLCERRDKERADACQFEKLPFVVGENASPHPLEVPRLTHREARYLDRHIPVTKAAAFRRTGLSMDVIRQYERIYRWFPTFAETEL